VHPGPSISHGHHRSGEVQAGSAVLQKVRMDLFKAGLVGLKELCSLGKKDWEYVDRRRVHGSKKWNNPASSCECIRAGILR